MEQEKSMSSPQHTSPVISRQASPERRLSRSRSRSRSPSPATTRRRSVSRSPDSRSLSRSASPQRRARSCCSRSSCSSHSDEEEEVATMDARKFKTLSRKGQRAYTRRVKEHNAMLEHRYVTLLQTLYKERIELTQTELTNTRAKQSIERGVARDLALPNKRPRSPSPTTITRQRSSSPIRRRSLTPPRRQRSPLSPRSYRRSRSPPRKRARDHYSPPPVRQQQQQQQQQQQHDENLYNYGMQQQQQQPPPQQQQQRRGNRGGSGSRKNRQRKQENKVHVNPQVYEPLKIDISRNKRESNQPVTVRLNTESINQTECADK